MRKYDVIVYGSYGFTGKLITAKLKSIGLSMILSGRNEELLKQHAIDSNLPYKVANVDDSNSLKSLLSEGRLVIHCAGPFQFTARQMVEACLETQTHYTDITGEYQVFEMLMKYHDDAIRKNIVIMPGTGFDVVPTDCLAMHLHGKLPTASHLELAFAMSKGGLSRGTARTMVEGLGEGGVIRRNGKLTPIRLGSLTKFIDFGSFKSNALCIPWGDVVTAFRSTGIPNIEVYTAVPEKTIRSAKFSRWINPLLKMRWVKNLLRKTIDNKPLGPSDDKLENGKSYLWGRASDGTGRSVEARVETASGYKLTAITSSLIASRILNESKSGYFTPAEYFDEHLILEVEGTVRTSS